MGWIKWPLLFAFSYGVLWLRQEIRGTDKILNSDQGSTPKIDLNQQLSEAKNTKINSKSSLNFAFQKLSKKPAPPLETEDNLRTPSSTETDYRGVLNLDKLLENRGNPKALIDEATIQLQHIRSDELPERIIVLREVIGARNSETIHEVENLFNEEREWLLNEVSLINDTDALSGYVGELLRLSIMADSGTSTPTNIIMDLTHAVESNPETLLSLYSAIQNHVPWELETWKEKLSDEQKELLSKKRSHH